MHQGSYEGDYIREILVDREGQTDGTALDNYNFTWTKKRGLMLP